MLWNFFGKNYIRVSNKERMIETGRYNQTPNNIIINYNLFLIRRKLTSEYDQMRLTTIITCNNYNKLYLRIPKIYNLKFINLTITGKSLPK